MVNEWSFDASAKIEIDKSIVAYLRGYDNCTCGAVPQLVCLTSLPPWYKIVCPSCGLSTKPHRMMEEAITEWNEQGGV